MVPLTCGIDWAEKYHDVALVDQAGRLVAKRRISDDVHGWRTLVDLLAEHGDCPGEQIPVAIETSRGLLVSCLRATGRMVYAINPLAVARYRERHTVARAKSDHADAMTLANILRVDADHHRPLPAHCRPIPSWYRRSRCWPGRNRMRSGTGSSWPTSCARCCASTSRRR